MGVRIGTDLSSFPQRTESVAANPGEGNGSPPGAAEKQKNGPLQKKGPVQRVERGGKLVSGSGRLPLFRQLHDSLGCEVQSRPSPFGIILLL